MYRLRLTLALSAMLALVCLQAGFVYLGTVRVDGGIIVSMTSPDASIGFTAGLTWVFRGYKVP